MSLCCKSVARLSTHQALLAKRTRSSPAPGVEIQSRGKIVKIHIAICAVSVSLFSALSFLVTDRAAAQGSTSQIAGAVARSTASAPATATERAPAPQAPFTDYRFEKPGQVRRITVKDLPPPFQTTSATNLPKKVARPDGAWPQAPPGFQVDLYATGLDNPRVIRTAPNGDFFVAEMSAGIVRVFRGFTKTGKPDQVAVFATDLDRPFGIDFYPAGPDPQWVYIGNNTSVVRFPYRNGDLEARGPSEHILDLAADGHST